MRNKKGSYLLLIASVILFVAFYFLSGPTFNFSNHLTYDVIRPVMVGSIFLFLASTISLFMERDRFKKWVIFSIIFIIASVFLVREADSFSTDLALIPKEPLTWTLGIIYLIISLVIVVYQLVKGRREGEYTQPPEK